MDWRHTRPTVTLDGDAKLDLDARRQSWLVISGEVEVYARDRDALSRSGSGTEIATIGRRREGLIGRRFLFSVTAGTVLCGFDGHAADEGILLFATARSATLIPLSHSELLSLLDGPAAFELSTGLERWIDAFAGALEPGDECVRPTELTLSANELAPRFEILRPMHGLLVATVTEGTCVTLGREELLLERDRFTPVTRRAWLQVTENPALVQAILPDDARRAGVLLDALSSFQRGALRANIADARKLARSEFDRLDSRAVREQDELANSFEVLAAVVEGAPAVGDTGAAGRGDALFEACRLVATEVGLTLTVLPDAAWTRRLREPIDAIAHASRVRSRRVSLRGEWWSRDNGPLVAFLQPDLTPVALLRERNGYVMIEPLSGTRTAVTPSVAASLSARAHMFLPSLGHGSLRLSSLWNLGAWSIRRELLGVLGLSGAMAVLAAITPLLSRVVFDEVIPQAERAQLPMVAGLLAAAAMVVALLATMQRLLLLRVQARMEMQMEAALMDRLLRLPLAFFRQYLAGDLADRVSGIATIRSALGGSTLSALLHGVFAATSLVLLTAFDPRLAMAGVLLAVLALGVVAAGTIVSLRFQRPLADRAGRVSGTLLQLISAIAKIRVAGAERRVFALWADQFAQQRAMQIQAGMLQNQFALFRAVYPVLSLVTFFTVLYAAGDEPGAANRISTGSFIAALAAFSQFTGGVLGLGTTLLSVLRVVPQWERVAPILHADEEVRVQAADPGQLRGGIEFRHVGFRYASDTPLVLDDISFRAEPGEMVALVGPSGSGKSTIVRLLLGLEQPASGSIFVDGQDLRGLDLTAVRQQMGVVIQSARVMPGDLVSNILGPWNLTVKDAWRAARLAGLAEDIEAMPMGMHTVVGEGGGTFSGGQLQRLMIARALVHEPRVIILDEATSALDNRTQRQVAECLDRLAVTRIVIAHRLSTIRQAHRIYVVQQGRIVESGTFETLVARNGVFAAMARRQVA